jgi:sacsin
VLRVQVYNWTDSPSIISGDRLLILDPHHRWTKNFPNPGGPFYTFVQYAEGGAIRDQMAAFSTIMEEFDRPFNGTIVRIPLRTSDQATRSDIVQKEASISDIANVLRTFATDFRDAGLLFMKNIEQISIVIGEEPPINISIQNDEQVRQ